MRLKINKWRIKAAGGLFLAVILAASIAEFSLPGSFLYNFKLAINERIKGLFLFSTISKTNHEIVYIENRLKETVDAVNLRITPKTQAELQRNFELHSQKALSLIDTLRSDKKTAEALYAASKFHGMLYGYEAAFLYLRTTSSETRDEIDGLGERIVNTRNEIIKIENILSEEIIKNAEDQSYEEVIRRKREENRETAQKIHGFIKNNLENLGEEAAEAFDREVKAAEQMIENADSKLNAGDFGHALVLLNQAERIMRKVRLMADLKASL